MLPAYIMSRQFYSFSDLYKIFGILKISKKPFLLIIVAIMLGLIYAAFYRNVLNIPIFPRTIRNFAVVAALIGILEELVFRGFIQGHVRSIHPYFSILFGTISHTAYKCCLFLSPVIEHKVDVQFLMIWTFTGGLLFGILKEHSKSIIPSAIAHSSFDILVYAECVVAPWWVW
jgi:membrane protease YdiL (CAAX protease family)